jgi:hypothetical protein
MVWVLSGIFTGTRWRFKYAGQRGRFPFFTPCLNSDFANIFKYADQRGRFIRRELQLDIIDFTVVFDFPFLRKSIKNPQKAAKGKIPENKIKTENQKLQLR